MRHIALVLLAVLAMQATPSQASAQAQAQSQLPTRPLKLLVSGAFRVAALALVPAFEKRSGLRVEVTSDTAGALVRRIEGGQPFDVVVVNRDGLQRLVKGGAVAPDSTRDLASVGVGIGIRAGAARPPLGTVEEFKDLLRSARRIAYIDPAAGGTAGIYLEGLFGRLGIADEVHAKALLVPGGSAAERIVSGEADVALQQASEILPVKGVVLAGMLPAEIQSLTTYSAGVARSTAAVDAARALLAALSNGQAAAVIRAKGMQPAQARNPGEKP